MEGKEVGGFVKSPVIKLACSDLQHTRTGDHPVEDEVARCKLGDQVIRDRQSKHIAEGEGGADYEGGRRDHKEGVQEHPNSPSLVEIALPS